MICPAVHRVDGAVFESMTRRHSSTKRVGHSLYDGESDISSLSEDEMAAHHGALSAVSTDSSMELSGHSDLDDDGLQIP